MLTLDMGGRPVRPRYRSSRASPAPTRIFGALKLVFNTIPCGLAREETSGFSADGEVYHPPLSTRTSREPRSLMLTTQWDFQAEVTQTQGEWGYCGEGIYPR